MTFVFEQPWERMNFTRTNQQKTHEGKQQFSSNHVFRGWSSKRDVWYSKMLVTIASLRMNRKSTRNIQHSNNYESNMGIHLTYIPSFANVFCYSSIVLTHFLLWERLRGLYSFESLLVRFFEFYSVFILIITYQRAHYTSAEA